MELHVLAVGDVCGVESIGFLERHLRSLRRLYTVDFCIVNGENASGMGLTPKQAEQILAAGADVITLGNHTWNRREILNYLDDEARILRPANFLPSVPGRGYGLYDTKIGQVAVLNLIGRCNMDFVPDNPFFVADKVLAELGDVPIFVDFHAEATSEKQALGYYLDGRVSALWGTHTHVPTADDMILPKGTGFQTDIGMVGAVYSVIGIRPEQSIAKFRGEVPTRYETPGGAMKLTGCVFTIDSETRRCIKTERVSVLD